VEFDISRWGAAVNLNGKNVVVTGGTQGLGLEIVRQCLSAGANVALCSRNGDEARNAAVMLAGEAAGRVVGASCDVSRLAEVDSFAEFCVSELGSVDALVCNAGIYGPKGAIGEVNWADWQAAIEINLMGAVYCCRAFLPALSKSARGKIVLLSGGGATKPLPFLSAYAASKAGLVRFGETLAEELRPQGIDVNMIAPGALNTRLLDEVLTAGPELVGTSFYEASVRQKLSGGTPLDQGAKLCAYLVSSESDGVTGRLISAIWDPWERLHELNKEIANTDIYTLRRIVPGDRGKNWDR
jgi:NAD(P)-dependent dehydrogenase (short-subunit alcohol dehydrogenase family)